jgi:hypothetical protein
MTPTNTSPLPLVYPDVLAFAEETGVAAYLPAVLELADRVVPGRLLCVETQDDWGPGDGYIVIWFNETGMSAEELMAAHVAWWQGLAEFCPDLLKNRFHFDSSAE